MMHKDMPHSKAKGLHLLIEFLYFLKVHSYAVNWSHRINPDHDPLKEEEPELWTVLSLVHTKRDEEIVLS